MSHWAIRFPRWSMTRRKIWLSNVDYKNKKKEEPEIGFAELFLSFVCDEHILIFATAQ